MCNLSQGVEARGIEKGMAKGIEKGMAKGIEKGMAKGIEKGLQLSVERLVKNAGWPFEKAMSTLEIPREQWKSYSDFLENARRPN